MDRMFNVLLVEDDPNLGEVTVESLSLLGHTVTLIRTAAVAFEALRGDHSFEVVLLDLRLGNESATLFSTNFSCCGSLIRPSSSCPPNPKPRCGSRHNG